MKPLPHTINGRDIVLAVDFDTWRILVAERAPTGRGTYYTSRHVRYTLHRDGGATAWVKQAPAPTDNLRPNYVALNNGHAWHWRELPIAGPVRVEYEPSHLVVDRSDLARTLDAVSRVCAKSLDVDGLLTIDVHAFGLRLHGHGSARAYAAIEGKSEPARDDLGRVVVLAEYLRGVVKAGSGMNVTVRVAGQGRALLVDDRRLWVADVKPTPLAVPSDEAFAKHRELAAVIRRAFPFASIDDARPNLNCVQLHAIDGGVWVSATDGHRAYREHVETAVNFGEVKLPQRALARLLRRKSASLSFAFVNDQSYLRGDDLTIATDQNDAPFPPIEQVTTPYGEAGRVAARTLPSKQWAAIATWLHRYRKSEEAVHIHVGHDDATVRLIHGGDVQVFGDATTLADLKTLRHDGPATSVDRGFRASYLAEAFAAFDDRQPLTLTVASSLDPLWLTQPGRTFVLMPIRV